MYTIDEIIRTYNGHKPEPIGKHRFFSVLVPFVENEQGEVCLMYEVRAHDMVSQPGEICFPGGHMEKGETPLQCALRETEEETGIPAERVRVVSQGDILYGYANYTLYTNIAVIGFRDFQKAKIQEEEVDEVFLVPLSHIAATTPQRFEETVTTEIDRDFPYKKVGIDEDYAWRVGQWVIPIYDVDGRVIWGLTARITEKVLDTLAGGTGASGVRPLGRG
jgi:coenzyme A diphosphatase NUDT7